MKKPAQGNAGSSQSSRILAHLQAGHTLTPIEALNRFNCFSLSQRITELRRRGYQIITTMVDVPSGKRVAEYRLESSKGPQ
jgi:Helix-turn-helix domain